MPNSEDSVWNQIKYRLFFVTETQFEKLVQYRPNRIVNVPAVLELTANDTAASGEGVVSVCQCVSPHRATQDNVESSTSGGMPCVLSLIHI